NLLGNAITYTDRGSVTLRLNSKPSPATNRVVMRFDVVDTGTGIASEDQERVFEPFVQLGNAERRRHTGLGLTISRQLVELMGGAIQLESAPGRGSCFQLEIPVEVAHEQEMKRAADFGEITSLEEGQPEYRILIVDDQRENWMLLERLVSKAGFTVKV